MEKTGANVSLPKMDMFGAREAKTALHVMIDGKPVDFPNQQPTIVKGSVMVPMAGVFELLGWEVHWSEGDDAVLLKKGNIALYVPIGRSQFVIRETGKEDRLSMAFDVPAQVINGQVMLPIFEFAEVGEFHIFRELGSKVVITTHDGPTEHGSLTADQIDASGLFEGKEAVMCITRVNIRDYLAFKGEYSFDFGSGVNLLIGGNGTGKTTLLRGIYGVKMSNANGCSGMPSSADDGYFTVADSFGDKDKIVSIPESNILSHSRGLLETVKYGGLQYEMREVDIIEQARVLPNRSKPELVKRIECLIGGSVDLSADGQSFVVNKEAIGHPIDLMFEASGFQKLALLARLIHNGQIDDGTVLLWDEPENGLNLELMPFLVDILLELVQGGVQIFLATHNYNLARYFDVRKRKDLPVMFHNFVKANDGRITIHQSPDYGKLPNNLLEKANEALFVEVVERAIESE